MHGQARTESVQVLPRPSGRVVRRCDVYAASGIGDVGLPITNRNKRAHFRVADNLSGTIWNLGHHFSHPRFWTVQLVPRGKGCYRQLSVNTWREWRFISRVSAGYVCPSSRRGDRALPCRRFHRFRRARSALRWRSIGCRSSPPRSTARCECRQALPYPLAL
jgi:hypothetical protein